ncbi:MAG: flagellar basal body-associated protein FliL [Mariprofundaceae bacterium]
MADEEKKEKGGGLLGIVGLVVQVLTLGAIGFVAWQMMQENQQPGQRESDKGVAGEVVIPAIEEEDEENAMVVELGDFTVNLAGDNAERYLKCKISAKVYGESAKSELEKDMNKKLINDLVIDILTRKTLEDVQKPAGKAHIKEELMHRLNKALGGAPVRKIFFDEFVIQ